ncbi:MAG: site-specific DNA-methyltransferase [Candidatus Firestonebacteria bacterium]
MIIFEKNLNKIKEIDNIHNKIICGETLDTLKKLPDKSVSLIITSPSYFLGKSYEKDYLFEDYITEHKKIIIECKRVIKDNGAIFWNVAQTIIDKETFPLGVFFYNIFKDLDFHLKNWIIWKFEGGETPRTRLFGRYENVLWFIKNKQDYIFNLDHVRIPAKWITDKRCNNKGKNPEDFWVFDERINKDKLISVKNKIEQYKKLLKTQAENYVNQILMDETIREIEAKLDGLINSKEDIVKKNLSDNIWYINRVVNISKKEKIKHPSTGEAHPCPFPEEMIKRIIKMSSNENDVVLDIFNGSGTVCKVANELNRKWIGIDKEIKYCEIAEHRISQRFSQKNKEVKECIDL